MKEGSPSTRSLAAIVALMSFFLFADPNPSLAAHFQDLYAFTGGADGYAPESIVIGANGVIYGLTYGLGGEDEAGAAFSLTPSAGGGVWTESVIYNFLNFPATGLVADANGNLFGATGLIDSGSLYELVSAGGGFNYNDLWDFGSGHPDPQAGLLLAKSGAIYGTTSDAVNDVPGTVFFFRRAGRYIRFISSRIVRTAHIQARRWFPPQPETRFLERLSAAEQRLGPTDAERCSRLPQAAEWFPNG